MSAIAVAIVVAAAATVYSAYSSSQSQEEAAETQAEAAGGASLVQWNMYQQQREDLAPWREAGGEAVNQLQGLIKAGPGEYQQSPYYNFLMEQGTRGLERGAAAKGLQQSGAEQKALVGYGQNLASGEYNTWLDQWYKSLNPLQSLAGLGLTGAQQTAQLGQQTAQQVGGYMTQAGEAKAAGQLGIANTLGQLGQQFGNYAMYNSLNQPSYQEQQRQYYNSTYGNPNLESYYQGW